MQHSLQSRSHIVTEIIRCTNVILISGSRSHSGDFIKHTKLIVCINLPTSGRLVLVLVIDQSMSLIVDNCCSQMVMDLTQLPIIIVMSLYLYCKMDSSHNTQIFLQVLV